MSEPERLARLSILLEERERYVFVHREVVSRRAKVLADRDDVHIGRSKAREKREDLVSGLP